MPIILPAGFNITSTEPADARFALANQAARLGLSTANVYKGLVVFQQDNNTLYVLIDATQPSLNASWQVIGTNITGSLLLSGSIVVTGSISATGGFTGSLQGTASWANNAISSSFASTSSFTPNAVVTASVSLNTITFTKGDGSTFPITVNTGSGGGGGTTFPFTGSAIISGSLQVTGSLGVSSTVFLPSLSLLTRPHAITYDTASGQLYYAPTSSFGAGGGGSTPPGGNPTELQYNNGGVFGGVPLATYNGSTLNLTASLQGTSSWAQNARTASFVTSSNVFGPFGSNSVLTASYSVTSSYILQAVSSSFSNTASAIAVTNTTTGTTYYPTFVVSASGIFPQLVNSSSFVYNATTNTLNTTSSQAISSSFTSTASFVNTLNQNVIISGSLTVITGSGIEFQVTNTGIKIGNIITDTHTVTGSINVSGSITSSLFGTASWANNALTSSFITASNLFGPFGSNSILSSSYALTASFALNAGGAAAAFPFTGSARITGSLDVIGPTTLTGSLRVSGSVFLPSLSLLTRPHVIAYDSASGQLYYVPTSSFGGGGGGSTPPGGNLNELQYNNGGVFGGVPLATYNGSILNLTASLQGTASWAQNAVSSSFSSRALSASFASTASYAENITISGSISNLDYIDFDTTYTFVNSVGRLGWDSGENNLQLGLVGGNVQLSMGEQIYQYVYNAEPTTLTKGQVVYVSGSQGNRIAVKLANNTGDPSSVATLGLVAESIASGATGWVITNGTLRKLNTLGLIAGKAIFLGADPGTYTQDFPAAPSHSVRLGYIERVNATVGSIFVKIDNGYELGELHDVVDNTTTSSFGDLLVKSGSIWIDSKQLTGSYGLTGSLQATSFTGSLQGTSSWANNALTSSFITASNLFGPFGSNSILSASFSVSSSIAVNSSVAISSSFTGTASLTNITNTTAGTTYYPTFVISGSGPFPQLVNSGSFFYNATSNTLNVTSSVATSASFSISSSVAISASFSSTASFINTLNQNLIISGGFTVFTGSGIEFQVTNTGTKIGNVITDAHTITGSLNVSGSITGSLFGTSSFATTASFALNGGVTQIIAGTNVTISPTSGLGAVTINSTATGGGGGSITVADEGSTQGTASYFDFTGAGVTATVSNNTASISIPGGGGSAFPFTGSAIISGSLQVTGSVSSTDGFTGSLLGTASFATTASYAANGDIQGYLNTTFDGMGSVILINTLDYYRVPKAGTITEWSVIANGTWPTMSFDVWVTGSDGVIPTSANSICGGNFPFISGSRNAITSSNLTNWTASFAADSVFAVNVRSSSVATRASLLLYVNWA